MTDSTLEKTIADLGYAKVLVKLRVPQMTAAAVRRRLISPEIENAFIEADAGQRESLSLAARVRASIPTEDVPVTTLPRVRVYPRLGLALGYADANGVAALEHADGVDTVVKAPELTLIRPVASLNARRRLRPSWGITALKADHLWAAGFRGAGVVVGHLDTGVDGTHPALAGAISNFAEFDLQGNIVPGAVPTDSGEHGTHTAGTIVGRETDQSGPIGMAPGATLASGMVIEGGQVINRILAGLEWIAEQDIRILSMSLGLPGYTPAFQTVIDALRAANILPVIAVGNEYANTSRSPGNYPNVLSVGAMGEDVTVADFSSSQSFTRDRDPIVPDLVGPGVSVYSSVPGGKFAVMDGTSMATPHIAGLAALLLSAKPDATANQLEAAIFASCSLPGTMSTARANRGVPDAVVAYEHLLGHPFPNVSVATGRRKRQA